MSDRTAEQLCEEKHAARAKRRYVALQMNGTGQKCVIESAELESYLFEEPELVASDVWMTVAEFEALPDFVGF